jgi:hypothetical protein
MYCPGAEPVFRLLHDSTVTGPSREMAEAEGTGIEVIIGAS